jgi:hypothetical protein
MIGHWKMKSEYRQQLPDSLRALVDEIETAAGAGIIVEHYRESDTSLDSDAYCSYKIEGGRCAPIIRYRDRLDATSECYPVPWMIAAHELLHLRRYFVEHVPTARWVDGRDPMPFRLRLTSGVENNIEHVVIEPALASFGFPLPTIIVEWDSFLRNGLSNLDRYQAMLASIGPLAIGNAGQRSKAENALRRLGLLNEAAWMAGHLRRLAASPDRESAKVAMQMVVFAALRLPLNLVRLEAIGGGGRLFWGEFPGEVTVDGAAGAPLRYAWNQGEGGALELTTP